MNNMNKSAIKKPFIVNIPFEGSLSVKVYAYDAEEALELGQAEIESMDCETISREAQFGSYEVYCEGLF